MAKPKSKISEIKKLTHKFVGEGTVTIKNNVISIDLGDEGVKNLHELVKNFNGEYVKVTFQQEDQEDVVDGD